MQSKTPYKKAKRRVGRGPGSGVGKTCGRGHKGQFARSGAKSRAYSEGGQNTLIRRLPKRGFNRPQKQTYDLINLDTITQMDLSEIRPVDCIEKGIMKKISFGVKVLSDGELTKAVTVHAHAFSKKAKEKIESAGGKAIVIDIHNTKTKQDS